MWEICESFMLEVERVWWVYIRLSHVVVIESKNVVFASNPVTTST